MKMFTDFVLQAEGLSSLYLLPILIICCLLPYLMRSFQKPDPTKALASSADIWFTPYRIDKSYDMVKKQVSKWRIQEKSKQPTESKISLFRSKTPSFRFVLSEDTPTRLIKYSDPVEGNLSFEFTETESGGSSIRVNYHPNMKDRIQKMRASFPLKIPFTAGTPCSACGKPVLPDFKICPYCGQKNSNATSNGKE